MKCPVCGAGLSAKYRVPNVQHPFRIKRHYGRRVLAATLGLRCTWTVQ